MFASSDNAFILAAPTTLKAVIALEEARLVYRLRDRRDSRKTLIYLTAKGQKLFSRVLPDMQYVNRMAVKGMSRFRAERGQEVAQAHAYKYGETA